MGVETIKPLQKTSPKIKPAQLKQWLDEGKDLTLLDVRNDYEVEVGTFKDAVPAGIDHFRRFPEATKALPDEMKQKPVVMFCTGGIRCEKSTAYLRQQGFEQVFHLEGGILKYLETVPEQLSLWRGECFVFDERVSVDHDLKPGNYELCRACRHPINEEDKTSPYFQEGVACPNCYDQTNEEQRQRFAERQKQMELAAARQELHLGAKMPERKARDKK